MIVNWLRLFVEQANLQSRIQQKTGVLVCVHCRQFLFYFVQRTSSLISFTEYLTGPVLYGSVSEWIIQYKKGLRKFNNFERLLEQDPTGQIMQVCTKCKH
jgi:hypothetical protein